MHNSIYQEEKDVHAYLNFEQGTVIKMEAAETVHITYTVGRMRQFLPK